MPAPSAGALKSLFVSFAWANFSETSFVTFWRKSFGKEMEALRLVHSRARQLQL
jgi:hypothetical protein